MNTFGISVLDSIVAWPPLIAKQANPMSVKNPNPTPSPIANPFFSCPSSEVLPSNAMYCPSTEVVEMHFTVTKPAFPQARAFSLSTCNCTGVPLLIRTFPVLLFTSLSTIAVGVPFCLLLMGDVIRTVIVVPLCNGVEANMLRLSNDNAMMMAAHFFIIILPK